MKPKANYKQNKKASKCLRETHGVKTINEMIKFIEETKIKGCISLKACIKMAKSIIEDLPKNGTQKQKHLTKMC